MFIIELRNSFGFQFISFHHQIPTKNGIKQVGSYKRYLPFYSTILFIISLLFICLCVKYEKPISSGILYELSNVINITHPDVHNCI